MVLFSIKLLVVLVFLVMFIRQHSLVWGVGLLTVASALLLDTFLGAFGREDTAAEFGFFYYVIAGALFAGAAFWLLGLLRGKLPSPAPVQVESDQSNSISTTNQITNNDQTDMAVDRKMLYDEIRNRLSRDDILDLMFDLDIKDADVMTLDQNMNQLILNIIDFATSNDRLGELTMAVERILTPLPASRLPRLERIDSNTPRTLLRQYLLLSYDLPELEQFCDDLGIDWEQLDVSNKKTRIRSLLLYLYHRNRLEDLLALMHQDRSLVDVSET